MTPPSPWKTPNEVMQLHKLKKRMKALQQRMKAPLSSTSEDSPTPENVDLDFSKIINRDKRKNPFLKNNTEQSKRIKLDVPAPEESNDKTLFALLKLPAKVPEKPENDVDTEKLSTFSNLLQKYTAEHSIEPPIVEKKYKHLTIDWALKTKLRLMSPKPFAWTAMLKASEEASGITGFVRCLDTAGSPTLDTSPRARFHQSCLYWQHPQLPWLALFPRARARHAPRAAPRAALLADEDVRAALLRDWTESFRSLFQLLRARHCPYFYVCADAFTVLFRAAGLGAQDACALLVPSTRGLRHTLRQEDVEFTMPLRPEQKRKLNSSDEEGKLNTSADSCYDTMDTGSDRLGSERPGSERPGSDESGDDDPDQFLSQLGLETETIRKINSAQTRLTQSVESSVDRAAQSLVLARGEDAQALFNWLLNRRAPTAAPAPPTLLAPVAFHGAALQSLKVRENVIQSDSKKYYSIELKGPILPTMLHSLFAVLTGTCAAPFSATFAHHQPTLAFTWAASALAQDESAKENEPNHFTKAFNKENLSDCGMSEQMLQHFCSPDPSLVKSIDSVKYNTEDDTYTW